MKSNFGQKHFFITGTGTDIGKTVVTRALLQYLILHGQQAVGYKPIKISHDNLLSENLNNDAAVLGDSSSFALPCDVVNPIVLLESEILSYRSQPVSFERLSQGLDYLKKQADNVIIEGTSGWRVLVSELRPFSDWVIQEQLPVILVIGIQEDCINQAMLTAEAIVRDGLPLVGWIANRVNPGLAYYAQTLSALNKVLDIPQLGEIPYLSKPELRDLSSYIDLSPLLKS